MRKVRYCLWGATLIVVSWAIAVASAFIAGKGKIWVKLDSEAGIISE